MAINLSDAFADSEDRAIRSATRQMPIQQAINNALGKAGNSQNTQAKNVNPDARATPLLRFDTVNIEDGVLGP
jgi:hypothetical protein